MRRPVALFVLAAWLLAAPLCAEIVRSTSRLNLRLGPSLASRRILVMSAGRDLLVLERRGEWLRVRANDTEGWVHGDYVTAGTAATDGAGAATEGRPVVPAAELEAARRAAAEEIDRLQRRLEAVTRERDVLAAELAALRESAAADPLVRVAEPLRPAGEPAAVPRAAIVAAVERWARTVAGADVTDAEVTLLAADRARVHCTLVVGRGAAGSTTAEVLEARLADGAWIVSRPTP